jgi:crossover junction endodeoxyribonuclease RuvC
MGNVTIGIDPGVTGAVAILGCNGPVVWDMPTVTVSKRQRCDAATLAVELGQYVGDATAFVELVHSMKKQVVASTFSFGESFGIVRGVLAGLGIPYELVTPQKWKRAMGVPRGDKSNSRPVALRLFPSLASELPLEKNHGKADALLIAEYGRRRLIGGREAA